MGKIILLPEEVYAKIAAGEVIEGPFSVVRELIDNSLDAHATHIEVTVSNGGKDYIQVSDNGIGMSAEDAVLALQKHTTSKIRDFSDLDTLDTMGFRGEALSSICAVSELTLLSRSREEHTGVKVNYAFGKSLGAIPSASNVGTEVSVRNLFGNVPARKKFLKSSRAEYLLIKDELLKKALSFHERGFSLSADNRAVYTLIPRKSQRERIADVLGKELEVNLEETSSREELFTIRLFVSNRNHTLANRRGQYFFINRRPVFDRSLSFALNNPARGIVPSGRFVYAFVFIEIQASLLDVNVHPAKKEIKIKIESRLFSELHRMSEKLFKESFYPPFSSGGLAAHVSVKELGWNTGEYYENGDSGTTVQAEPHGRELFEGEVQKAPPIPSANAGAQAVPGTGADEAGVQGQRTRIHYQGVLFRTYLLFEGADFILLVDQHAAHERVLYERYRAASEGGDVLKHLLIPINFTPPPRRYADIHENLDRFRQAGIMIEPFGEESFNIVTLPGAIPDHSEGEVISSFLDEYYEGKMSLRSQEIHTRLLEIAACRNAVKEGDLLKPEEALALIEQLEKTEVPFVCPHGRPTTLRLPRGYFEKAFKRR